VNVNIDVKSQPYQYKNIEIFFSILPSFMPAQRLTLSQYGIIVPVVYGFCRFRSTVTRQRQSTICEQILELERSGIGKMTKMVKKRMVDELCSGGSIQIGDVEDIIHRHN